MPKAPLFQHRHYEEIAKAIADTESRDELIDAMANMFQRDNANFSRLRFFAASSAKWNLDRVAQLDNELSNKKDVGK